MLTELACKSAACPPDKALKRFADSEGLYLEVRKNGGKDILQSHTKGIEQAARLFIARLLLIMESRLILNWEAPGSTMLIPGRFILSNPNPAQVDNVVEHVVARAK